MPEEEIRIVSFAFSLPETLGQFKLLWLPLLLSSHGYSNVYLKQSFSEKRDWSKIHANGNGFTFEVTVRRDSGREQNLALPWHPTSNR